MNIEGTKSTKNTKKHEEITSSPHHLITPSPSQVKLLLCWFWAIFLFYSLSAAKLPTYIVPAYPAAALLIGRWLDRSFTDPALRTSLRRGAIAASIIAGVLMAAALLAPRLVPKNAPVPPEVVQVALQLTGLLFFGCLIATLCLWRADTERKRLAGALTLVGTLTTVIGLGVTRGYSVVEQAVIAPYQQTAEDARPDARAGLPIVFYHIIPRRPSMLYYARDYSPLERKESPLLPTVRQLLPPGRPEADVVTTQDVLRKELAQELASAPDVSLTVLQRHDGWVLLRLGFH